MKRGRMRKVGETILIPKGTQLWNPVSQTIRQVFSDTIVRGLKIFYGKKEPEDYEIIIGPYSYNVSCKLVKVVETELNPGEVRYVG